MNKRIGVALISASVLAGCGGGGDSGSAPAVPDSFVGIFKGTTGDSRTFVSMVLTDGTFYDFYSGVPTTAAAATTATNTTTNPVGGVVVGTGSGSGGSFSSSNAYDYQVTTTGLSTGVAATTLSASYTTYASMSGTFTHNSNGAANTFASTYNSTLSAATPSLTTVAGIYSGTVGTTAGGTEDLSLIILPAGTVTGQSASGCFFSGTVAPHATNNAYDLSITFAATVCTYSGTAMTGLGLYDSTESKLYGATSKTDKTAGIIFVVKKTSTSAS
ncbi:hypothetical protein [Paraburkholderia ginsengisoli]|uniref:Lipoprotein n=1 Tax=Paraburkholderia ginsengisoli TaxID=311231 RepID=A0A7T4N7J6_9BURK|nr:hypothetical protein [Paraburkholderia ginsengisoli]QQC66652.1 hypothetical protein I6I06_28255 [Paraburkholderia ginsengisoli]